MDKEFEEIWMDGTQAKGATECSFCGLEKKDGLRLIHGPNNVTICNHCVVHAIDALLDSQMCPVETWIHSDGAQRQRIMGLLTQEGLSLRETADRSREWGLISYADHLERAVEVTKASVRVLSGLAYGVIKP